MHHISFPHAYDGADCFSHFAALPYAIFLDGGQPSYQQERYHIISAEPYHVLECPVAFSCQSQGLWDAIKQSLHELHLKYGDIPDALSHLPFTIGAMGYISYDVARYHYPLPNLAKSDIALPDAILGFYDWSIVIDHQNQTTYLIACSYKKLKWVQNQLSQPIPVESFSVTQPFVSNLSFTQYGEKYQQIQHHIRQGDCYQVNLAQRYSASYAGSTWAAYRQLRRHYVAPFSAYLNGQHAALLSFSPERFLRLQNQWVETKPIKGTAPRYADPIADQASAHGLLHSEKDKAENIMIVDLLRNDLGKCCQPGSIRVPKLAALESFSNVHHLVSTIIGQLQKETGATDVLRHCFPGGSITGAPKQRAMQIIDTLEPHRRSAYCGSILYIDVRGHMDSQIMIRTCISTSDQLYCYAGGAIVADSKLEDEYQESKDKIAQLLNQLTAMS